MTAVATDAKSGAAAGTPSAASGGAGAYSQMSELLEWERKARATAQVRMTTCAPVNTVMLPARQCP